MVIVTGGAGGIGSAVAAALVADHALVLVDTNADALEEVAATLRPADGSPAAGTAAGPRAGAVHCVTADVTDEAGAAQCVDQAIQTFGRLDGLANIVGGGRAGNRLPSVTLDDWDYVQRLTLTSVFLMCRAALPHLTATGGAIVNLASVAGIRGMHLSPAYCAAKGGVIGLTAALANDHGPSGVRVNCVAPGAVATPMLRRRRSQEQIAELGVSSLVGRVAEPAEIAGAVKFLLSDDAAYVMGQTIVVDGGFPTFA